MRVLFDINEESFHVINYRRVNSDELLENKRFVAFRTPNKEYSYTSHITKRGFSNNY